MICVLGCDHAGLALTKEITSFIDSLNLYKIVKILPKDNQSVDYPDFAKLVCDEVVSNEDCIGILVCGSGIGMSICANKISGIRAALCINEYMAKYARMHNNANVLCLGERIVGSGLAKDIVNVFLTTAFEGGRHKMRVDKINLLD